MFRRLIAVANPGVFLLCVVVIVPACNVDWLVADRQLPEELEPVAYASQAERAGSAGGGVDITIRDAQEVDLVEAVVGHRQEYHRRLRELNEYYTAHGYATKASWAQFELDGLRHVRTFRYLLDAEVASDQLKPVETIEEADALYEQGREVMRRAGHGVPALFSRKLMIEAAQVFRDLVERYPSSDKIDDAAFFCGEIHKEYLPGLDSIAVRWFERAWTWDPATPHPARFQAAVVYDYRLHDRDRALELYQSVLKHETNYKSNVRFATRRIHELTAINRTASALLR